MHTQVVRSTASSAMLLSCRVCLPGVGTLHPCKETGCDTEWNLSNDHKLSDADKYKQSACTRRNRPIRHQESGRQVVRNGHGKLRTKGTHSIDISEWCHAWNRGRASSNALTPSTRRWNPLAWSYGENDSSPSTPVYTLISVLTNTSQLAQRIPGQPGRHSTGCVHRLAGREWTC